MIIGIDASRAFIKNRTGIEEYSYQVIKHLRDKLENTQVVLYIRSNQEVDFELPENWRIKKLWLPYFSSQIRFSFEFLFSPIDVLFVPAHTVPPIHPKNTIVVVHGLEYEFVSGAYSEWAMFYMRTIIKNSCKWAKTIIAVSENTKKDLMKLYDVAEGKITVIYEGCNNHVIASEDVNDNSHRSAAIPLRQDTEPNNAGELKNGIATVSVFPRNDKYLLFIGRLEERKNIVGIIKAFEILKEHYKIPHKLILAGKFGYGAEKIKMELKNTNVTGDIILLGYVSEEEKWELLKDADVFLFPTFYEGFGIPILEAQSVGVPVVAGDNSSIPEIVKIPLNPPFTKGENIPLPLKKGEMERDFYSAILVDPKNAEQIADAAYNLISDKNLRDDIIKRGYENVKRFSWEKCADQIATLLNG